MANESKRPNAPRGHGAPTMPMEGERELIVVTRAGAQIQPTAEGFAPPGHADAEAVNRLLDSVGATMRPLFDVSPTRARQAAAIADLITPPGALPAPDLTTYLRVDAADEHLDRLASDLRDLPTVEAAYVKPAAMPAMAVKSPAGPHETYTGESFTVATEPLNAMLPMPEEAPPTTPDFQAQQLYLGPAAAGVDARFAWTQPGGRGAGVGVIDVEGAWRFTHEDLKVNQGGVAFGTPPNDLGWRNHGTAVLGEISGDANGLGITGIAPDAVVRGVSIFGPGSAAAIHKAADLLRAGDVLLIELHRQGPGASGQGQDGFIAIEWWPDDFDAIRYATAHGVLVVEAAGNGSRNLDDAIYDRPATGFPTGWSNPFRRGNRDSGAILVGAGAPPPGTHGHDHGPDRSRLAFSNFGSALDVQGWGREVTTTGYGDLQGGANEDLWYTNQFSGTSSASPIVVGVLACVQGNRRARGATLLTPATARQALRSTGSPQTDAPGRPATQRIGTRPNLRQLIPVQLLVTKPLYRYWNARLTDHFYTMNFAELGRGKDGWVLEGVQCFLSPVRVPGMVPLHRYWNAGIADHFYTTNLAELGLRGAHGWAPEGIAGWVYPQAGGGRVALLRYWNARIGDHFYTTNRNELGSGRNGYVYEGVACWVATIARPPMEEESPEIAAVGVTKEVEPIGTTLEEPLVDVTLAGVPRLFEAEAEEGLPVPSTFAPITEGLDEAQLEPTAFAAPMGLARAARTGGVTITIRMHDDE